MGNFFMVVVLASWTGVAFVYRWAESLRANRLVMAGTMGLVGVVCVLLYAFSWGIDLCEADVSQVIIGCGTGALAVLGVPAFLAAVARGDLSITWTVMTLSFALSSLLVMVYPGESPTVPGAVGLVIATGAVVLLGLDMNRRRHESAPGKSRKGWGVLMSIAFVTNALTMYAYKVTVTFQPDDAVVHKLTFLLSVYVVFAVGSVLLAFFMTHRGSVKGALVTGSAGGALIVAGGVFTLLALSTAGVPGSVFYPATSGGSSVLVVVLSVLFLKERPGRFGWAGIAAGAAALVLLGVAMQAPLLSPR